MEHSIPHTATALALCQDSDLIVFPEEAEFRKVKQTDQRVYMLIFKGSNKKFFFWMQEVSQS